MMKDFKNMTQEELEKHLSEIIKKNYEKGVILLDRNYNVKLAKSVKVVQDIEDIDSIIAILRAMKYIPNLKPYCKGMTDKEPLIHPITEEYSLKEKTYDDFVSREEFINRTGIFVTPSHFSYIYDMEWKEAKEKGISMDGFIDNYEENSGQVMEVPLHGTFKYCISDDILSCIGDYDDIYYPNIWEIINCLARTHASESESRQETIYNYKSVLNDVMQLLTRLQLENATPATDIPS